MIRYYYQKIAGKRHCVAYSTDSLEELLSWGRNHGCGHRPPLENHGLMPRYDLGSLRAPQKPVDDNVFKIDAKNWRKKMMQGPKKEPATPLPSSSPPPPPPTSTSLWSPKTEPGTERLTITPELALRMLDFVGPNRSLNCSKVKRMATKMRAGDWSFTHQGLAFSNESRLMDGQHRLHALIESEMIFDFNVTYALDPKVFKDIDEGAIRRTAKDLLAIRHPGAKNTSDKVAVARSMLIGMTLANSKYVTPDVQAEVADWYYDLITQIMTLLAPQARWAKSAPIVAAFVNAVRGDDEWSGGHGMRALKDVAPHAARFAGMNWEPTGDPMKAVFVRFTKLKDVGNLAGKEDERRDLYAYMTTALRHCLQGHTASKFQVPSYEEWGGAEDYGKRPRAVAYTGPERGADVAG